MNTQRLDLAKFLDYVQKQLEWSDKMRSDFSDFLKKKDFVFIEEGKYKIELPNAQKGLAEFKSLS